MASPNVLRSPAEAVDQFFAAPSLFLTHLTFFLNPIVPAGNRRPDWSSNAAVADIQRSVAIWHLFASRVVQRNPLYGKWLWTILGLCRRMAPRLH